MKTMNKIKLVVNIIKDERTKSAFRAFIERSNAITDCYKQEVASAYKFFLAKKKMIREEYEQYHEQNKETLFDIMDNVIEDNTKKMEEEYGNKTVKHAEC